MSTFPKWIRDAVVNCLFRGVDLAAPKTVYVGLLLSTPGRGGSAEVSEKKYSRRAVSFTTPDQTGLIQNDGEIRFDPAEDVWGAITQFGIFDAPAGGRLLIDGQFREMKYVGKGDIYLIPKGELVVQWPRSEGQGQ